MDELMICIRISHTMAAVPIIEVDAPTFDHTDTEEKPSPVPSASRISDNAAIPNAPPITAAHDTPDECDSSLTDVSLRPVVKRVSDDERSISSMRFSVLLARNSLKLADPSQAPQTLHANIACT